MSSFFFYVQTSNFVLKVFKVPGLIQVNRILLVYVCIQLPLIQLDIGSITINGADVIFVDSEIRHLQLYEVYTSKHINTAMLAL